MAYRRVISYYEDDNPLAHFRKYRCRHCGQKYDTRTVNPVPASKRYCPRCEDELGITARRNIESLESMQLELENRIGIFGEGSPTVKMQRECIARQEALTNVK